ncbi:MAG TPA: acetylxylan esterase, partial [Gemmataceae bacterium]
MPRAPLPLPIVAFAALWCGPAAAQPKGFNYDESKVPKYTLPDPLVCADGTKVTDAKTWSEKRRPEILKLFETHVYGRTPRRAVPVTVTSAEDENALGGKAVRKLVTLRFGEKPGGPAVELLIYLPREAKRPVPVFVGLNFGGNHTVHPDPAIPVTRSWVRNDPNRGVEKNRASDKGRGAAASRWPVEEILARGYGVATAYYGDIDPDFDDGFRNG